jgi:cytochrome c-type biogenesis protein CcmH
MSRKKIFNKLIAVVISFTFYSLLSLSYSLLPTAYAQGPDYDQINNIAKDLNCPTCAGINLADCRTQTCNQWRDQIGDLLRQGYSDQEVLDYFVTQYGVQVLQAPPKRGFTLSLWILPVMALLAGGGWLVYTIRGWANQEAKLGVATSSRGNATNGFWPEVTSPPDNYLSQVEKDLGIEEV